MDINSLIRLKDALQGAQSNTSKMLKQLEQFENRLTILDEKMRPIQNTTTHYTKAKENIALTLLEVGKTYEHFRTAGEVRELIMKTGYSSEAQEEYFHALDRVVAAKRFFDQHPEIKAAASLGKDLNSIFNYAITTCSQEFERLLKSCGKSVERSRGQWHILNPLSPTSNIQLQAICAVFERNALNQHLEVYRKVRTTRIIDELHTLEATNAEQWKQMQQDGPYQRHSHPFHEFFLLAFWSLRAELQLWGSTLPSSLESLLMLNKICDAIVSEIQRVLTPILSLPTESKQSSGGSTAATMAVKRTKLLLLRLDILDTFTSNFDEFIDLCQPDVRKDTAAAQELRTMRTNLVQSCIEGCEYLLSATSLLEAFIVQNKKFLGGFGAVSGMAHTPVSLGPGSGSHNGKLGNFSIHSATGGMGNSSLHGSSAGDPWGDAWACDLHPVTGNALYCCQEVLDYHSVYERMCNLAVELRVTIAEAVPTSADDYVHAVLGNLYSALEDRAVLFEESNKVKATRRSLTQKGHALYDQDDKMAEEIILHARKHLFLINNLYTLINRVRDIMNHNPAVESSSSTDKNRRISAGSTQQRIKNFSPFLEKATERFHKAQDDFCDTVNAALGMLPEDIAEFKSRYDSDKAGQGKLLKAKFQMFNTGMEALLQQQGEWRVSSAGLRENLAEMLVEKVLSAFRPFFEKYSVQKFSKKHMDEYLKYRPQVVENHLHAFFGKV